MVIKSRAYVGAQPFQPPKDSPRFEADSLRRTEIRFTQFDFILADVFGEAREIIIEGTNLGAFIEGTNLGASFTDLVVGYRADLEIDHTLTYDREYELPR